MGSYRIISEHDKFGHEADEIVGMNFRYGPRSLTTMGNSTSKRNERVELLGGLNRCKFAPLPRRRDVCDAQ